MIDINLDLLRWLTNSLKKTSGVQLIMKLFLISIYPKHRPIIRKFKKRKVHSSFIDNI